MYTFKTNIDAQTHDEFVLHHPLCNLLQTSNWAKVKSNWEHHIVGVYNQDVLVGSALVLVKKLPLSFTMMYVPRGPILDYENQELLSYFMKELKTWAKTKRCLFIKMNPAIHVNDYFLDEVNDNKYEKANTILDNFKKEKLNHSGYTTYIEESIQPRFEACVVKTDEFEANLPRHTKRLIKDAMKKNVEIVKVSKDRVKEFSDVVALTENRKNVNLRNYDYFMQLMEIYGDDCYLFLAQVNVQESLEKLHLRKEEVEKEISEIKVSSPKKLRRLEDIQKSIDKEINEFEKVKHVKGNKVIAGILSIKVNNTMEMLYAGMDDSFKKFMPQYLLYTENMKYAFDHGCDYANMGGVEGDFKDGLTKFKSNFNPTIFELIGEFDLMVSPLYKLASLAYNIRKKRNQKRS